MAKPTEEFDALTPQQVNSWPVNESAYTASGELAYYGTGEKDAFLKLAMERFKLCAESSGKQREQSQIDNDFACGIQWDAEIEARRAQQRRPCLTINRIDGFLAHAVNSFRQARPEIKIIAAADGADEEIAEVKQGLIRHIQTQSKADIVYDESFRQMCTGGISWMRVVDDWSAPDSMDQDLFVRSIPNPFTVYFDPFVRQPDWSDGRFAFVVEDLTRQQFKAKFGDETETASLTNFASIGDQSKYWFPGGNIRVAEYFHIEMKDDYVCELENKSTRLLSELPKNMYFVEKAPDGDGLATYLRTSDDYDDPGQYIGRARKAKIPEVYWALITAVEVLKERKWKGRYIPLIPVLGNVCDSEEGKILAGMVRYAREPQRMYNYMYTSFVETVALVPRAPWLVEMNQIPDGAILDSWQRQNTDPQVFLRYKQFVDAQGNVAPAPVRLIAEPPIAAFVQGLQMADQNLKSVFRIFDASLGQRGPQESGLAINARKVESDTGIYNWADNFVRSLHFLGIILEDLLPSYYNTEGRVFEIIQEDDTSKRVVMNKILEEAGQKKQFDLSKGGKYAVQVSTGPSMATKRQASAQGMIDFFKNYPAGLQACAHLLVGELDFPGADKIKAQLEKILPANLREPDPNAPPIPPEFQQQMAEAMQHVQVLTQALHTATDKREEIRLKEEYATLRAKMKEDGDTFRTQMTQEVNLALGDLKAGVASAQFTSQKIFDRLEHMEAQMLQKQSEDHAMELANTPSPDQPSPSSAGPQAGGGQ